MLADLGPVMSMTIGRITFKAGTLSRKAYVDNGKGTMEKAVVEAPVCVQIDALTQAQRDGGYSEDDVRLLILADGLDQWLTNGRLQNDDVVTTQGQTFSIIAPSRDPANAYWTCRGRRRTKAPANPA